MTSKEGSLENIIVLSSCATHCFILFVAVVLKRKPLVTNTVYSEAAKTAAERLQKERTYRSKVWLTGYLAGSNLLNYVANANSIIQTIFRYTKQL